MTVTPSYIQTAGLSSKAFCATNVAKTPNDQPPKQLFAQTTMPISSQSNNSKPSETPSPNVSELNSPNLELNKTTKIELTTESKSKSSSSSTSTQSPNTSKSPDIKYVEAAKRSQQDSSQSTSHNPDPSVIIKTEKSNSLNTSNSIEPIVGRFQQQQQQTSSKSNKSTTNSGTGTGVGALLYSYLNPPKASEVSKINQFNINSPRMSNIRTQSNHDQTASSNDERTPKRATSNFKFLDSSAFSAFSKDKLKNLQDALAKHYTKEQLNQLGK